MAKKSKFKWEVKIEKDYMERGREYLVVDLNDGLNSAIPLESKDLENFKAEKLAEITMFEGSNLDHIKGIELLGYKSN